jgi:choline dehydrogenase-like flavoprotein
MKGIIFMKTQKKEFDVIVVGTGPGGSSVARELAQAGKSVLIIERGDFDPLNGSATQFAKNCFIPGKGLIVTNGFTGMLRGITTGGSSLYFCATAFDPPIEMFKNYGVDLSREKEEIKNDIPIYPIEDELMPPAARPFAESALDLGYDVKKLNKFIYQNKCRTNCQLCTYGCPYDAKWSGRLFVNDAIEHGAKIINHAKAEKVIIEDNKAIGVEYKHDKDYYRAYAPLVVISAGGISSPVILRKSGIRNVGYDFFFDPLIFVLGKLKGLGSGKGVPMTHGIHLEEDGIMITELNVPYFLKLSFDMEVFRFVKAMQYKNYLPIMIKVRDNVGGRVTDREWIWKKLAKEDKNKIDKGAELARRILENAGATDIYRWWYVAAHPGGTVKIGDAVDTNLKTRFDNLYVCDCSVMPKEWGVPPTYTILCLAKRLSKHLLGLDKVSSIQEPVRVIAKDKTNDVKPLDPVKNAAVS